MTLVRMSPNWGVFPDQMVIVALFTLDCGTSLRSGFHPTGAGMPSHPMNVFDRLYQDAVRRFNRFQAIRLHRCFSRTHGFNG
jgi:hypothetical protein